VCACVSQELSHSTDGTSPLLPFEGLWNACGASIFCNNSRIFVMALCAVTEGMSNSGFVS